jgi:hypothetical protein
MSEESNAVPVAEIAALSIEKNGEAENNGEAPNGTPAKPTEAKDSTATASSPPPGAGNFKTQFQAFSKFGDTKSDGKHITLSQSDKWMKQAKVER